MRETLAAARDTAKLPAVAGSTLRDDSGGISMTVQQASAGPSENRSSLKWAGGKLAVFTASGPAEKGE